MPFVLPHPAIDPELVSISLFGVELALRWYALAYIAGLFLGWRYVVWMTDRPALWGGAAPMTRAQAESLLTWMVFGVILGGRLGFVLFYQPAYFASHPWEIPAVWQGGMSFHGGLLGVVAGLIGFGMANGVDPVRAGDAVSAAAPIGIFFGRIANFINAELWGRPSHAPWAFVFPGAGAECPPDWQGICARHPSQLYEAGLEGLVLGLALLWAVRRGALARPGLVFGLFLTGYGAARLFVERFRQADGQFVGPDNPWGHVVGLGEFGLTMGQLLSLPMLLGGLLILLLGLRRA